MNIAKIQISKDFLLITYKLLHDALLLFLMSFAGMLVIEGLLPGLVSSHLSLAKVAIAIFLILIAIVWIGSKFQIIYDDPSFKKNKLSPILTVAAFLLIGNSLLKFAFWENIVITTITLFVFFLIYSLIFPSKK